MKSKKNCRLGEIRKNKQGFTMRIIKYTNNKSVRIRFDETGEERTVRYFNFVNGNVRADLLKYPPKKDAVPKVRTFLYSVATTAVLILLNLSAIGGIIYWNVK